MTDIHDSYSNRLDRHQKISHETWTDWRWQQQNAVKTADQVLVSYPNLPQIQTDLAHEWKRRGFRFQLTPYMQSLVIKDSQGNPIQDDPIWNQFFPNFHELLGEDTAREDEYSPENENWEIEGEMITPIAHHKYNNRVIIYTIDVCMAYCAYCLRSLQSTAEAEAHGGKKHWQETLEALRDNPEIEEVIISGGDPLLFDNNSIESMLNDIRSIPTIKAIRIHTRAFTHNPFRIDAEFCRLLVDYSVTEIAIHMSHPQELTRDCQDSIDRIRQSGARTLLLAQTPLLKRVNDNSDVLRELFMRLYTSGVKPYYLLHNMPNIPAVSSQRTSVKRGVELMNTLGRTVSHPAMPEFIIVHRTGKRTVPKEPNGTSEFIYDLSPSGHPVIRFKNWKGNWETYMDSLD